MACRLNICPHSGGCLDDFTLCLALDCPQTLENGVLWHPSWYEQLVSKTLQNLMGPSIGIGLGKGKQSDRNRDRERQRDSKTSEASDVEAFILVAFLREGLAAVARESCCAIFFFALPPATCGILGRAGMPGTKKKGVLIGMEELGGQGGLGGLGEEGFVLQDGT